MNDFFLELSFQNFTSYTSALSQTLYRFRDCFFRRSSDANELIQLNKQCENEMSKYLTLVDLVWLGFNFVVGSRIFTITGVEAHDDVGPVIVLSYVVLGISSLFLVFCYIEFAVEILVVVGFIHANTSNLEPFFSYGTEGVFRAATVVYWSYTGFDLVANMAEETRNPTWDIPLGLIGSMSLISVVYCLMVLALPMMVKYTKIYRDAAFSFAFENIKMKWAKYVVRLCALKGMSTCMVITSMGQGRYTTQIARAHMIPPWFALVYPKTKTPIYATLLVTIISYTIAFFLSLEKTTLWVAKSKGWIRYVVSGGFFFAGTIGMMLLPKQRVLKIWGVPFGPWLLAMSILMNMFLIGSLGSMASVRFFIWTDSMLVYYILIRVHATYDFAHQGSART
ncbi:cationic amino acid transporter 8, vacuolar [Tanacetum coccineum]